MQDKNSDRDRKHQQGGQGGAGNRQQSQQNQSGNRQQSGGRQQGGSDRGRDHR